MVACTFNATSAGEVSFNTSGESDCPVPSSHLLLTPTNIYSLPSPRALPLYALTCEGDACGQVALTWDETKQQYKVQNNSDRMVRVEASNLAGGNRILVEAGKSAYLEMKSIIGPYRANYE
jgi:hypothetical protein